MIFSFGLWFTESFDIGPCFGVCIYWTSGSSEAYDVCNDWALGKDATHACVLGGRVAPGVTSSRGQSREATNACSQA